MDSPNESASSEVGSPGARQLPRSTKGDRPALHLLRSGADISHVGVFRVPMGTQQATSRWAPRPMQARLIRVAVLVTPFAASILFVALVSKVVPAPLNSFWLYLSWWAVLTGAATLVLVAVDRVARRLLPLALLFKLSLVFPDRAPSRFRTALDLRRWLARGASCCPSGWRSGHDSCGGCAGASRARGCARQP